MYKKPLLSFCIMTTIASHLFAGSGSSSSSSACSPSNPCEMTTYTNVNNLPTPLFPSPPASPSNLSQPSGYINYQYDNKYYPAVYYEQNGNKFYYNLNNGMLLSITGTTTIYGEIFNTTWNYNPRVETNQTSAHLATVVQKSQQAIVTPDKSNTKKPITLMWGHHKGNVEKANTNSFTLSASPADATFNTQTDSDYNTSTGVLSKNFYITKSPKSVPNQMVDGTFIAQPLSEAELSTARTAYNLSYPGTFSITSQEKSIVPSTESQTTNPINYENP